MIRHLVRDRRINTALAVAIFALSARCDSKDPAPSGSKQSTSAVENSPSSITVQRNKFGTGVIKGKVTLSEIPRPSSGYLMSGDVFCARAGEGKAIMPDGRKVGTGGAMPFVFVYVKSGIEGSYDAPSEAVTLDQKGCHYEPHVMGLMVNQPLEIRNSDPTAHNVHAQAQKNDSFNIAQAQQNSTAQRKFDHPEVMVRFKCDVHSWMEAYAGVLPHQFFAVSGEDGQFSIGRLPAGEYVVEAWHELYGRREQRVTLKDGEQIQMDFVFARRP